MWTAAAAAEDKAEGQATKTDAEAEAGVARAPCGHFGDRDHHDRVEVWREFGEAPPRHRRVGLVRGGKRHLDSE